jgi:hypothetical protein
MTRLASAPDGLTDAPSPAPVGRFPPVVVVHDSSGADAEPGQAITRNQQPANEGSIRMSGNSYTTSGSQQRRVRHEVRDAALTMLVTALLSTLLAMLFFSLSAMARMVG